MFIGSPTVKVNLTQRLSQSQNKVVGICDDQEIKLETPHTKYMEAFKQYTTMYKTKPSTFLLYIMYVIGNMYFIIKRLFNFLGKVEARSALALNTMNEGNSNIQALNESVQELKQVEIERNDLLKQLVDLKKGERDDSQKENKDSE